MRYVPLCFLIRDEVALRKLPAEERAGLELLWKDVGALLARMTASQ